MTEQWPRHAGQQTEREAMSATERWRLRQDLSPDKLEYIFEYAVDYAVRAARNDSTWDQWLTVRAGIVALFERVHEPTDTEIRKPDVPATVRIQTGEGTMKTMECPDCGQDYEVSLMVTVRQDCCPSCRDKRPDQRPYRHFYVPREVSR